MPAVVDLACMRDAMNRLGGDSNKINPLVSWILCILVDLRFVLCFLFFGFAFFF